MTDTLLPIDVSRLRVGIYVHLDLSWRQHPFAFSHFKIKSQDQLDTIRSLGVQQVRYDAGKSDCEPEALAAPAAAPATAMMFEGLLPDFAETDRAQRQRELLLAQQASLARCEQKFGEASRTYKQVLQNARAQPENVRESAETLVRGMVEALAGEREVAIRLLSERAGDESSLHAINVSMLSVLLGRACGLSTANLREVAIGALLHDIGKLELPARLRWTSDRLTGAEQHLLETHVEQGVALGKRMGLSTIALEVIAQHHELADGSGYPKRLRGVQISAASRIVALVNRYDNLCNPGNVSHAVTPHEALSTLFSKGRAWFDGPTLALFVRMMGIYPPGSVVQLSDGCYAITVAVNPQQPLKPRVLAYDPKISPEQAPILDLEHTPGLEIAAAIKPTQLPRVVFDYLSPRKRMRYFYESSAGAA